MFLNVTFSVLIISLSPVCTAAPIYNFRAVIVVVVAVDFLTTGCKSDINM